MPVDTENTKYSLSPKEYTHAIQQAYDMPEETPGEKELKNKAFTAAEQFICSRDTWVQNALNNEKGKK